MMNPVDKAYAGRQVAYGDYHAHAATGGTSDGLATLTEWTDYMAAKETDFVALVDHRQVRHTYLPEWDNATMLCGTEPGTYMEGCRAATKTDLHYNMIFRQQGDLEDTLTNFPEFGYTHAGLSPEEDDHEGHFGYPHFTYERMAELVNYVRAKGGIFTHNHPTTRMQSTDPLDYYFCDYHNIEIIYYYPSYEHSHKAYHLWKELLEMGKRLYAIAGGDEHGHPDNNGLSTVYVPEKNSAAYVDAAHVGDMTCGCIGIQMCATDGEASVNMGGTWTGGNGELWLRVGDMYKNIYENNHVYRLDIYKDSKIVYTQEYTGTDPVYVNIPLVTDCMFYRAEVTDATTGIRMAIGNPIFIGNQG